LNPIADSNDRGVFTFRNIEDTPVNRIFIPDLGAADLRLPSPFRSTQDVQHNPGDEVENENHQLEERHPGIVDRGSSPYTAGGSSSFGIKVYTFVPTEIFPISGWTGRRPFESLMNMMMELG